MCNPKIELWIEKEHRRRIEEDIEMSASAVISVIESKMIDVNFETNDLVESIPLVHGEVAAIYDEDTLASRLEEMTLDGHCKTSIGVTSS
jgi:hypothetical protein